MRPGVTVEVDPPAEVVAVRVADEVRESGTGQRALVPCPVCATPFAWPPGAPCERCGADLAGPAAARVFDLDRRAAALRGERREAVARLAATSGPVVTIDLGPPPSAAPPRPPRRTSRVRPQVVLAVAGAVLLLAAAVVFIAVTWPTWPPAAQVAFVVVLTVLGAVGARTTARRGLPVTADALGVVTLGVAGYSLGAARAEGLAGLEAVDPLLWATLVATLVAVAAGPLAGWGGLRDAPRRVGAVAAVVAAGSGMAWLVDVLPDLDPAAVLLAAAPTVAVALLLHCRWVLRRDDPVRHLVRLVPAGLLTGAAVGTGLLALDVEHAVAVGVAATVGLPVLVGVRRARPAHPWSLGGAVVAVLWAVQLVTFLLTDAVATVPRLDQPRLVTVSVVAVAVGACARLVPPPAPWARPVVVATALAAVPAAVWTLGSWVANVEIVARVLEDPFTGWPAASALSPTDLVLAVAAVVAVALLTTALWPHRVAGVVAAAAGAASAVALVTAAAAGVLPTWAPVVAAGVAAVGAAALWIDDARRWEPVAVTELAALGVALVDVDLLALAAAGVALHLLVVAAVRGSRATAASGTAAGLVALAAASDGLAWSDPTATLVVTAVAGGVLVVAQLLPAARPWRATPTDVVVLVAAATACTAAAVAGAATTLAVQLAIVAVAAAVHAVRPGRGWAVWLSSVAVTLAVWTLLDDRGVDVVEAYTLPSAIALAAAGAWRLRTTRASSWAACWPACAMASLPTLGVLLEGPDPLRVLLLTTGAVAVALVGHVRRLAAPLALGAAVAIVAAVVQLDDWTAELPRWITFGALGGLLIWTSATYEAQLQRARRLRQHLAALR